MMVGGYDATMVVRVKNVNTWSQKSRIMRRGYLRIGVMGLYMFLL